MKKMTIIAAVTVFIAGGTCFLMGKSVVMADQQGGSARPRLIEVEEKVWYQLNQDLLNVQNELVKSKLETQLAQAEVEKFKQQLKNREKEKVTPSTGSVTQTRIHRVLKNESLWKIAVRYYSDPYKWRWLFKANMKQVDDPNMIYPEQILDVPMY